MVLKREEHKEANAEVVVEIFRKKRCENNEDPFFFFSSVYSKNGALHYLTKIVFSTKADVRLVKYKNEFSNTDRRQNS